MLRAGYDWPYGYGIVAMAVVAGLGDSFTFWGTGVYTLSIWVAGTTSDWLRNGWINWIQI